MFKNSKNQMLNNFIIEEEKVGDEHARRITLYV